MKKILFWIVVCICLFGFFACRGPKTPQIKHERVYTPQVILALGDSLTYGLRVDRDKTYPAQLQQVLHEKGYTNYTVINAGISGETTAGTLKRIDSILQQYDPDIVILTIGANDILKNKNIVQSEKNIAQMIECIQAQERILLLSAIKIPTLIAQSRAKPFREMYPRLATKYNVSMVPNFLAGVTARPSLNQDDSMHPNADGYTKIVHENIFPALLPLIGGK